MIMSENDKEKVWEELVRSSDKKIRSGLKGVRRKERVVRRKEWVEGVGVGRSYLSDLWLLVIMLVVWISFLSIVELVGAGC